MEAPAKGRRIDERALWGSEGKKGPVKGTVNYAGPLRRAFETD